MNNRNTFKIIALIALMIYVFSPVDALPGPVDDMILCILYAFMNYRNTSGLMVDNGGELNDQKAG